MVIIGYSIVKDSKGYYILPWDFLPLLDFRVVNTNLRFSKNRYGTPLVALPIFVIFSEYARMNVILKGCFLFFHCLYYKPRV